MPFDLRITFTGLCLFVHRDEKMHVLLPRTDQIHASHPEHRPECEEHTTRLIFDTAHLRKDATAKDNIGAHYSLRNRVMEVPATGGAMSDLPDDLVRLEGSLKAGVLEQGTNLVSRVTLPSGRFSCHEQGECFGWKNPEPQRMSHVIVWTIEELPQASYIQTFLPLKDGSEGRLELFPINIDGTEFIELTVYHTLAADLPPDPILDETPNGTVAHHFAAYYEIVDSPDHQLPIFMTGECSKKELPPCPRNGLGANPARCMNAAL